MYAKVCEQSGQIGDLFSRTGRATSELHMALQMVKPESTHHGSGKNGPTSALSANRVKGK